MMNKVIFAAAALAIGLGGVPAMAQPQSGETSAEQASTPKQARIPFVNHGGIRNWRMVGDDTLYVQDAHRNWYEAKLMRPVTGIGPQFAIGFETRGIDSFDRFSNVVIRGERYPVESLVRIAGEPPRKHKRSDA